MDWGLGHATRCIPLIRTLLELNCELFVAGSGPSLEILKEEFPFLPDFFTLPSYDPKYAHSGALKWKLARQFPRLLRTVKREEVVTNEIVRTHNIEVIISDNRYGCRSAQTVNIFMGHQINLPLASPQWLGSVINGYHRTFLDKFDGWWIPDRKGEDSLAGELSQTDHPKAVYLGPLSRFDKLPGTPKVYDIAFILSGPEPQRTLFEERVLAIAAHYGGKICIVRGTRDRRVIHGGAEFTVFDLPGSATIAEVIGRSGVIVARPGYSTIMDLAHTGGKAVFIPTPGQAEQEHLARRLERKGIAGYVGQAALDFDIIVEKASRYAGFEGMATRKKELQRVLRTALKI